jgi:hypothetical protein
MKVIYIGMYGGGKLYFNTSIDEAKRRYIEENPEHTDWDFTIGDSGRRLSAVEEHEIEDELAVSANGLAEFG